MIAAGVERSKVFRGLVIDHLCVVEGGPRHDLRLVGKETGESNQEHESDGVTGAGLEEAVLGQRALHEYVRPERRRGGTEFER